MSKKKNTNYTLTLWAIIVICITILILLATCNGCKRGGEVTQPKTDTSYIPGEKTIVREPLLVLEGGRIPDEPKYRINSFVQFDIVEKIKDVDSNAIVQSWIDKYNDVADKYNLLLSDWNLEREYVDSARFSAALVTVKNKIHHNRNVGQQIFLDSALRTTTIIPEKKRNKVGLAIGGQYWSDTTIALGAGFTLQTKKGRMYGIKGLIDTKQRWGVMGEIIFPMSLRRK
jgi:uncharacterized protein YutD